MKIFPWIVIFLVMLAAILVCGIFFLAWEIVTWPVRLIFHRKKIEKPQNSQSDGWIDFLPRIIVSLVILFNIWFPRQKP